LTSPSWSILDFVSASRGVDASIQVPPSLSWMAVDRPPIGQRPNLAKGLSERVSQIQIHAGATERRKRAENRRNVDLVPAHRWTYAKELPEGLK